MKITSTLIVNAPIERVWQVLAHEFASVGSWASSVAHSDINHKASIPEGAPVGGRVCAVPGFGNLEETFTFYDDAGKTYTYEATGMPFFVKSAHNTWKCNVIDANTTEVSLSLDMQTLPVIGTLMAIPLRMQINKLLGATTEELKYYLETGNVHPRKQALLKKQNRPATA